MDIPEMEKPRLQTEALIYAQNLGRVCETNNL